MIETFICEQCGKSFKRHACLTKKSKHLFCGRKCSGLWFHSHHKKHSVECDYCGKMFERIKSRTDRHAYNFCSRECSVSFRTGEKHPNWKGGQVTVQCAQCGASIKRRLFEVEERSERFFCDVECRGKWQSENYIGENHPGWTQVIVSCSFCGKQLSRQPWQASREHSFCDIQCFGKWQSLYSVGENNPSWRSGHPEYYGPNWLKQRRKARRRDSYRCQHCGLTEKRYGMELDVHHIKPFREFNYEPGQNENYLDANRLRNLISLCRKCHLEAENNHFPIQFALL